MIFSARIKLASETSTTPSTSLTSGTKRTHVQQFALLNVTAVAKVLNIFFKTMAIYKFLPGR